MPAEEQQADEAKADEASAAAANSTPDIAPAAKKTGAGNSENGHPEITESMMSFDEAKRHVLNDHLSQLGRSKEQLRTYRAFRNKLAKKWKSTADYVLHTKFEIPVKKVDASDEGDAAGGSSENPEPNQLEDGEEQSSTSAQQPSQVLCVDRLQFPEGAVKRLVENDFSYNFEPDVRHFLLWKLNEGITKADVQLAVNELRETHGLEDYVTWVNPEALKSVPEIDHAHIVFRTNIAPTDDQQHPYKNVVQ